MGFRFAGFEIDVARQELRRAGAVVQIEPQVFDLIVYLVQHRDRIVSKDDLIETYLAGRVVSEAAVSSRISAARRALGDSGNDQGLIRTLRKRGFRFVGETVEISSAPIAMAGGQLPDTRHSRVNDNDAPRLVPNAEPLPLSDKPSIGGSAIPEHGFRSGPGVLCRRSHRGHHYGFVSAALVLRHRLNPFFI